MKLKAEHYANVISSLALLASFYAIISSNNSNKEIAERSGAFDRPGLVLSIGGFRLPPALYDTINIVYGGLLDSSSMNISSLPIQISNEGNKDAEDITCIIQYPKAATLAIEDVTKFRASTPSFISVKRSISEADDHTQTSYQIKSLNPGFHININDPINLSLTNSKIKVRMKDSIEVEVQIKFSMIINTSLGGKDAPPQSKVLQLSCYHSTSIKDLVALAIKDAKLTPGKSYTAVYVYPEKRHHPTEAGNLDEYKVRANSSYLIQTLNVAKTKNVYAGLYDNTKRLICVYEFDAKHTLLSVKDLESNISY